MNDYKVKIIVEGNGENEWYIQEFCVEANSFEEAVANVERDLNIA